MSKEENKSANEAMLYELGFHFVPTIAEDDLEKEFTKLKKIIESGGGVIVSGSKPALIKLAYTISQNIDSKNYNYDTAYFGWVKFNVAGEELKEIRSELDLYQSLLRYMIIKTTKDADISAEAVANVLNDRKMSKADAEEVEDGESDVKAPEEISEYEEDAEEVVREKDADPKEGAKLSDKDDFDKAIDEIVGEGK